MLTLARTYVQKELDAEDAETAQELLTLALVTLGEIRSEQDQIGVAIQIFTELLEIRRRLYAEKRAPKQAVQVAAALQRLGKLHIIAEDWKLAFKEVKEAVELWRRLSKDDPENLEYLAETLIDMGICLVAKNSPAKGEKSFGESRELFLQLAEDDFYFNVGVTRATSCIYDYYMSYEDLASAKVMLKELNELYIKLNKAYPGEYEIDIAKTTAELATLAEYES